MGPVAANDEEDDIFDGVIMPFEPEPTEEVIVVTEEDENDETDETEEEETTPPANEIEIIP